MGRVEGKVAIVTGGALGFGRADCRVLAKEGAKVAVTDIHDKEGQEVVDEIMGSGGVAKFWHLDVKSEKEVGQVFAAISKELGKINVLVNNAGVAGVSKPTHEVTEEQWDEVMSVNVKGVFFCTKHVVPYMLKAGGGSIINMSSVYGLVSGPDCPPYHASKGAVRLMSKTDALLYAKDKIRVNSIHPGFVETPMVANVFKESGAAEEMKKAVVSLHPLGHLGEPSDIAYGVLYLASDESKFVTGSELVIDGGYTAQ